jgi:calcineurin-like phosphoesterase family protein
VCSGGACVGCGDGTCGAGEDCGSCPADCTCAEGLTCQGGSCQPPAWPILAGAGDICSLNGNCEQTALLLDALFPPGTPLSVGRVVTLGDNAYENGSDSDYASYYDPHWGRHKPRTQPAVGNHEYQTPGATGYFDYFGAAAGDPSKGWYAYDLGTWRVYVLNSDCWNVGGCGAGAPQESWLRADLAANPRLCQIAYWHRPRFTSTGEHDDEVQMQAAWQALYDYGADVVLSAHNHFYERLAPKDANGLRNDAHGIRSFIVGTGGRSHAAITSLDPDSEVHNDTTYGVLEVTLKAGGYEWRFIPVAGSTFTDAGSAPCH